MRLEILKQNMNPVRVVYLFLLNCFVTTIVVAKARTNGRRLYAPAPRCVTGDFSAAIPFDISDDCGTPCWGDGGCASPEECSEAMMNRTNIYAVECDGNSICIEGGYHAYLVGHDPCRFYLRIVPMNCFSSMATAIVENKGKTLMRDLQVGDWVLTKENQYQPVYTIDHKNPNKRATFVQIYSTITKGEIPLELTESHMVIVHGMKHPIVASAVKVGDVLQAVHGSQPSTVTKITYVEREGIWNPVTADGTIAVDGIIASTHSVPLRVGAHDDDRKAHHVEVAGRKIMSHHDFLHALMTPYRAMCLGLSISSFCDSHQELNGHSQLGIHIVTFASMQSELMQNLIIFVAVQTALLFQLLSLVTNHFVIIGAIIGLRTCMPFFQRDATAKRYI